MSVIEKLKELFKSNSKIESMFDFDKISSNAKRSYLQRMVMDAVLNYVARTILLADF